jgi:hypothetical protein
MPKNNNIGKVITFNKGINLDTDSRSLLGDDDCWENANVLLTPSGAKMVKSDVARETATITSGGTKVRLWEHYETRTDYDTVTGGKRLVLYTANASGTTSDIMITNSDAMKFSTSKLDCDINLNHANPIRAAELNGGMYFVDGTARVKKIFGTPLKNAVSSSPGDLAPGAGYLPAANSPSYKNNQVPIAVKSVMESGVEHIAVVGKPYNLDASPNIRIQEYNDLIYKPPLLDLATEVQADNTRYAINAGVDGKVYDVATSHYNDLGVNNVNYCIQEHGGWIYLIYVYVPGTDTYIYKFKFDETTTTPITPTSYKISNSSNIYARLYIDNSGQIYYQLNGVVYSTDMVTSEALYYDYTYFSRYYPRLLSNSVSSVTPATNIGGATIGIFYGDTNNIVVNTTITDSALWCHGNGEYSPTANLASGVTCTSISYDSAFYYVLGVHTSSGASRVYITQLEKSGSGVYTVTFKDNSLLCTLANNNATVMTVKNGIGYYSTGNNVFYQFNLTTGATIKTFTITDTTTKIAGLLLSNDNAYVYLTDNQNHRVGKYTLADDSYYFFGSYGSAPGQFNNPLGLEQLNDGTIAVVDSENYRVQLVEFFTNTIQSVYTLDDYQPPKVKPVVSLDTATTNPITQGTYYLRYSYIYRDEMGYVESRQTEQMSFDVNRATSGFTIYLEAGATAKYTNIYISTPTSPDFVLLTSIEADKTSVHMLGINLDNKPFMVAYASRPPAGCQIISEHHNRMWYTKNNRIYISSINRADYCPDIFFDDTPPEMGGWIDVGNGEALTGLGMYGGFVFAFKNRGVWRISGDPGQTNFGMSPVDDTIGCDSHESIQLCENSVLCWLGNNSVYSFNGEQIVELKGIRKRISALTATQKQNAYAVYYPDKHWYEITFPADGASAADSYRYQFDVGGKWVRNTSSISTGHTVVLHSGDAIGANVNASASTSLVLYDKFTGAFSNIHHETARWEQPLLQRKQVVSASIILDIPATADAMTFDIAIGSKTSVAADKVTVTVPEQTAANLYCVQIPFRFPTHKVNALEFSIDGGTQATPAKLFDVTIVGIEINYAVGGSSV